MKLAVGFLLAIVLGHLERRRADRRRHVDWLAGRAARRRLAVYAARKGRPILRVAAFRAEVLRRYGNHRRARSLSDGRRHCGVSSQRQKLSRPACRKGKRLRQLDTVASFIFLVARQMKIAARKRLEAA